MIVNFIESTCTIIFSFIFNCLRMHSMCMLSENHLSCMVLTLIVNW